MARTLFDKLLAAHQVRRFDDGTARVLVDRVMLHERTGSLALQALAERDRALAAPGQVVGSIEIRQDQLQLSRCSIGLNSVL